MRIVALSDTHGGHDHITVPDGDVLIHAGDFTNMGRAAEVAAFDLWLSRQPHKHKLVVPGNHDLSFGFEEHQAVLHHGTVVQGAFELEGVRFYADSFTPEFGNWAFQYPRKSLEAESRWATVPQDTEVLITHGPPWGIRDYCSNGSVGCEALSRIVRSGALWGLKHHIFGHIHESYGSSSWCGIEFHNVAMTGGRGRTPTVIDLPEAK